jgi:ABC-type Fe3+/spermidine/putrescine transport system ATPase subunit
MNFFKADIVSIVDDNIEMESVALGRVLISRSQFSSEPKTGSVEIGIRPEMFKISKKSPKPPKDSGEGRIEEISFFGDYTQYKVKFLSSNENFIVSEMHSQGRLEWNLGDCVGISWAPDSLVGFV